MRVKETTDIK